MLEFNRSYDGGYVSQHSNDEFIEKKEETMQPLDQEEAKECVVGRCIFTPRKTIGRDISKHTTINYPYESSCKTMIGPQVRENDAKSISGSLRVNQPLLIEYVFCINIV
jgi:hypothetical protein